MRPDMFKVIVERPRLGGGKCRKGRRLDYDDLPSYEGMGRPSQVRYYWQSLNENLSPLRRFLERRVGRRWDEVYAEICANLRPQSTVQQHVRDHLDDFVDRRVKVAADGSLQSFPKNKWVGPFYVDPRDGVLRRSPARKRTPPPAKPPSHAVVGRERELIKVNGIWYWVVFADVPPPARRVRQVWNKLIKEFDTEVTLIPTRVVDIVTRKAVFHGRYRKARLQASGRDLRRYGLANDAV